VLRALHPAAFFASLIPIVLALPVHAGDLVNVGAFSRVPDGALPSEWKPLIFKKQKAATQTDYAMVRDDGVEVVRAESRAAGSGLERAVTVNLTEYPVLQWRWKVDHVVTGGDPRRKDRDDYAARVYVIFEYEPDKTNFSKRLTYGTARLLFGDVPFGAISYIWGNQTQVEAVLDSPYLGDFIKLVVVENASARVGQWVDEKRNVYEDYRRAFGAEPPLVEGVVLMTDTDNTGERATAFYGDLAFVKAQTR